MNTYDLSVIIPARNEDYLHLTVQDVLKNIRGNTEIIIIADGCWPIIPIEQHERITMIYNPVSIGQRAAVNLGVRVSRAKYIMKLDAHCMVDEGFDVKLMADCEPDWTVIPRMYNLHVFDWECKKCGNRWYQGPTPKECKEDTYTSKPPCENTTEFSEVIVWQKRNHKRSDFYMFDRDLKFNYWRLFGLRSEGRGQICDVMCNLGACWFMERKHFWDLDGLDENHGSWGQMGVEISCKSWLSGGQQKVNKNTWFAHLFRTQSGFGFPYHNPGTDKAREYSKDYWLNDKWPKATYKLQWLIDKFKPIPDWHLTKAVIYYTDNRLKESLFKECQEQLLKATGGKLELLSVSLKPIKFGKNITLDLEPGYLTMARQILEGLKATTAEVIYLAEHDVMYHPSHFEFNPTEKDKIYYNVNVWKIREADGHALFCNNTRQLSALVAYRNVLITHFTERVCKLEKFLHSNPNEFKRYVRQMGFEPGTHGRSQRVDDLKSESFFSEFPNLDIRHESNLTPSRWSKEEFRNQKYTEGWKESTRDKIPGW